MSSFFKTVKLEDPNCDSSSFREIDKRHDEIYQR